VRPKIINEVLLKKNEEKTIKFDEDIIYWNEEEKMEIEAGKTKDYAKLKKKG
jgi:hypothetical protein